MYLKKKGISPLIATVLLIAFTISVGAIIGAWVTGFSKTKSDDLDKSAGTTLDCAGAGIKFAASDIGDNVILVTNNGDVDFSELKITVQNGTGQNANVSQYIASGVSKDNPLRPGDTRVISNSSMSIVTGNKVTVTSTSCINAQHSAIK